MAQVFTVMVSDVVFVSTAVPLILVPEMTRVWSSVTPIMIGALAFRLVAEPLAPAIGDAKALPIVRAANARTATVGDVDLIEQL